MAWADPGLVSGLVRTEVVVARFDTPLTLRQASELLAHPDLQSVAIEAMKLDQRMEVCVATEATYAADDLVEVGRLRITGAPDDVRLKGVVPCGPGVAIDGRFPGASLQVEGETLLSIRSVWAREPVAGRGQHRQLARSMRFSELSWGWTRRERRHAVSTLWETMVPSR